MSAAADHRANSQRQDRGEPVAAALLAVTLGSAAATGVYAALRLGMPGLASVSEIWHLYWNYEASNVARVLLRGGHDRALLAVAALIGVPVAATILAASDRRPVGQALVWGAIGTVLGGTLGWLSSRYGITPAAAAPFVPALAAMSFGTVLPTMLVTRNPARRSKTLRGVTLERVDPIPHDRLMTRAARTGRVPFAGQLLPAGAELKHILGLGTTGTGKSQAIHHAVEHAVRSSWTVICVDPSGGYAATHPRRNDLVFNPADQRSAEWDLLADVRSRADIGLIADAICPAAAGDFFSSAANKILRAVLLSAKRRNATSPEILHLLVNDLTKTALAAAIGNLSGSGAAEFFDDANAKAFGSILLTLATATERLRPLAEQSSGGLLSLSEFADRAAAAGGQSLFLTYNDDQIAMLGPLYTLMLNVLISRVLSLPPSGDRRILLVADEFDALGGVQEKKVPIGALLSALVRGRKYGLSVLLGAQSLAQIRDVYGRDVAETILENLSTRLILNVSGESAEFASSRLLGESEIEIRERSDSVSHTAGSASNRSESTAHRLTQDRLVLPAQISSLQPLHGYLKITGSSAVLQTHWPHHEWPELRTAFIPAELAGWGEEPLPEPAAADPIDQAEPINDEPVPDPMALLRAAGVISGENSSPDAGAPVGIIGGASDDNGDDLDEALQALGYEYA